MFREVFHLLIDIDSSGATSGAKKLRTEIDNTDGAFNKLKVGAAGAFDLVKEHAVTAALAAGAAITAFAAKSISAFQDTALGAGKLADALGITMEEASRLQEVAGDLGINVGTVEASIGRMNRTASTTPGAFDDIGAAIVRNADGTTNVIATFESAAEAVRKIPDAADRAAAAQKIFGRSWQDISVLIMSGADGIARALDSVEAGKIMTNADRDRAERYRDVMDEVRGIVEEATVALGAGLVPAVTTVADAFLAAKSAVERFQSVMPDDAEEAGFDIFTTGAGVIEDFKHNWMVLDDTIRGSEITASVWETGDAFRHLTAAELLARLEMIAGVAAANDTTESQEEAAEAAEALTDQLNEQADTLDEQADAARASVDAGFALRDSQREAADAVAKVDEVMGAEDATLQDLAAALDDAAEAAFGVADATVRQATEANKATGVTLTATQKSDIFRRSLLDQAAAASGPVRQSILDHIAALDGIDPVVASEIRALIDRGAVAEAEGLLQRTSRERAARIEAQALTAMAESSLNWTARQRNVYLQAVAVGNFPRLAAGGTAPPGGAVAGENFRPELLNNRMMVSSPILVPGGTKVTGERETARMLAGGGGAIAGSGTTVNVTINMPPGSNGNDVVRAIKQYQRFNGGGQIA